jgi:hypothetical protein
MTQQTINYFQHQHTCFFFCLSRTCLIYSLLLSPTFPKPGPGAHLSHTDSYWLIFPI